MCFFFFFTQFTVKEKISSAQTTTASTRTACRVTSTGNAITTWPSSRLVAMDWRSMTPILNS